jgi:hypothetical protein
VAYLLGLPIEADSDGIRVMGVGLAADGKTGVILARGARRSEPHHDHVLEV